MPQSNSDQKLPIVIFGVGQIADVVRYYLEQSGAEVVGFTVDEGFSDEKIHAGLPVVTWNNLESTLPPSSIRLFCPISYRRMNALRKARFLEGKARGYTFASFVHPNCVNNAFRIGENCFILENCVLQPFSTIGDNVILWSGLHIGHHSTIGDHCFLASHVVVSGCVTIGERCFFGVNATVGDNVTIGDAVLVGAGALVLRDMPSERVVRARASEVAAISSSALRGF